MIKMFHETNLSYNETFFIIVNQQLAYFCKDESISSTNNKFKCYEGN